MIFLQGLEASPRVMRRKHTYLRQTCRRSWRSVVKRRSCSIHAWNTAECTWSLFTYSTRGKFVYIFWPGLIEILSSCRPPTHTHTNNTTIVAGLHLAPLSTKEQWLTHSIIHKTKKAGSSHQHHFSQCSRTIFLNYLHFGFFFFTTKPYSCWIFRQIFTP